MATTEQYLSQLQADKQALVDNLVEKGVEATANETFTSLVPKVLDIQSGGGAEITKGFRIDKFDEEGYAKEITLVGFTTIPDTYFQRFSYINGDQKTWGGHLGIKINFSNDLTKIGNNAFENNNGITSISFPESLTSTGQSIFKGNNGLTKVELPINLKRLAYGIFENCKNLKECVTYADLDYIENCCFRSTALENFAMPNITKVPGLYSDIAFNETPIKTGGGFIYVPDELVETIKSNNQWRYLGNSIKPINIHTIEIVGVDTINTYNGNKTHKVSITYNGGASKLFYKEQEGYILTVSNNATITQEGVITINDTTQVGESIIVTATSTYDNNIVATKTITVDYIEPSYSLNLNDGQWVEYDTTSDGKTIYMSDAGSYNVSNGKSLATITVTACTMLKLYIRSYGESNYDYAEAFAPDVAASRGAGLFNTRGKASASNYEECVYNLDGATHTIDILYSKDGGGNGGEDRGYFYIAEIA